MENYNNNYIDNTQAIASTPYYNQPTEPPKKGLAITSMVIGILSMTLCCVGGSLLGLIGLILGIVALAKKQGGTGMSIAGIATSVIGMLIGIYALFYIFALGLGFSLMASEGFEDYAYYEDYSDDSLAVVSDFEDEFDAALSDNSIFSGKSFQLEDGSVIYFEENGTFHWYQSDDNHNDNYYSGTYSQYNASDAVDYIVNDLPEYGVTQEELDDYFERNMDDSFYSTENFCCLVLHNDELVIEGEGTLEEPYDTHYMGFYADGYYDAANMSTGEYAAFTLY